MMRVTSSMSFSHVEFGSGRAASRFICHEDPVQSACITIHSDERVPANEGFFFVLILCETFCGHFNIVTCNPVKILLLS
jgi:hypothetical protein